MMRVTYIGPIRIVSLPMSGQIAERHGDPIEVDDDYGVLLCEQTTNWKPADPESQAVLDEFYRWVAAHEKRETIVDDEIVVRWVPRHEEEPAQPAVPESAADPSAPTEPASSRTRTRQTTASNKES
jgi:hypothetical protein